MISSEPSFDLDVLLAPIAGGSPAGSDLRYTAGYDQIRAARRAADDKQQGRSAHADADDKLTQEDRAAAALDYWRAVQRLVTEALANQSKDLQLAVWLLEADTYVDGFPGATRALELIRRLLDDYWSTVYPAIEDDDEPLALRAGVMEWINDRLPGILKRIPLSAGPRRYSLAHYEVAEKATTEELKAELAAEQRPSVEQFVQAMAASSVAHLEAMDAQIEACVAQVQQLERVADARFGAPAAAGAPAQQAIVVSFNEVRRVLDDCHFQVGRTLRAKAPRDTRAVAPGGAPAAPAAAAESTSGAVTTGEGIWERALQLVMHGQLDGLRLAQDHIVAASSGRERFLRQLQLSELCLQAGMPAFAYPILDELGRIIDARDLVTWEDAEVIRRTWSALAGVCRLLARLRPESAAREADAQQRLSALATDDPNAGADR